MADLNNEVLIEMLDQLTLGVTLLEKVEGEKLQFRFCYANAIIESLLRFPLTSLTGHTLFATFPQTYIGAATLPNALATSIQTQKRINLNREFYHDEKVGAIMYDAYCQPIGSKYSMIVMSKVDTFDEVLKNDQNLSQLLLSQGEKAAKMCSWILEPQTRHIVFTKAFLEVHQLQEAEVSNLNAAQKCRERIHPDDEAKMQAFRERENRTYPDSIYYRYRIPDGSYIWLEDIISNELPDGRIIGTTKDVNRQYQTRLVLMQKTNQLDKIMETSPEVIYVYDLVERRNVFSNKSLFSELGFTAEEVMTMGETFLPKTVHPEDLEKIFYHHSHILPNLKERQIVKLVYRMFNKKKNKYSWFESTDSVFEFDESGKVRSVIGIARNISREKKAEMLQDEAQSELEEFVYSLSHNVRAPIRHIDTYLTMFRESDKRESEEAEQWLDRIAYSANRISSMIEGLLDYSRTRKTSLKLTIVRTQKLVKKIIQESDPSSNIEWKLGDLPDCEADLELINQVWENLILNAIKYSSQEQEPMIEISAINKGNWLEYSITDNGVGFDPKYKEKLFGLFQRLHLTQEFKGHGIGLANVKRIIKLHGGEISGKGEVGKGASFVFSLPSKNHG